ncbi:retropepsin-like aspartic protease [Gillisia sp. Hel_I_29]|uniref:retropepsin-like aspartic protease n=1 Tax=Gillisia sp. Hel_I_29 TaxID=1249975 RepID=UPI0009DF3CE8|nr:retropepsin-like aspartic protease [Gillisia sp. Hel_I_29]
MRKFTAILIMLLSTLTYSQENLINKTSIPFTLTQYGHIIIPVEINGVEGKFIFDTGAGINIIFKNFADKIENLQQTDNFYTGHRATGEELQVDLYNLESLSLGSFNVKNVITGIYDIDFEYDGLISLTLFRKTPISIDFRNKVITIESESSMLDLIKDKDFEMPIQITNDRNIDVSISTNIKLNNKLNLNVGLDSGAGFDVYRFNSRYLTAFKIDSTLIKKVYKKSYFKEGEGNNFFITKIPDLIDDNNNASVKDFDAIFIEGLIYEGIMGINWIGEKLTIDISNHRILVQK